MSRTLRLDQIFYGTSPSGYGILGTSLTDRAVAQSAINVCLAVGQDRGSGLVKPILLSRVLGDRIVMARLCNGGKDSLGRNSIFVHALVALVQEVRSAHVTTFSLDGDGIFRDRMPDWPSMPVFVEARPSSENLSSMSLELPAAIETSEPDAALMRRIVSGRENELSWSTFALDDMPGYDIICLSLLASTPEERNIYNTELKLVRGVTVKRNAPAPVSPPCIEKPSCPPLRNPMPTEEGTRKGRNGLLIALLLSIAVNVALLAVLAFKQTGRATRGTVIDTKSQYDKIVEVARQKFSGDNEVKDKDLLECGRPIENLFKKDFGTDVESKKQIGLFEKLLAYKHFVEEFILNQTKEK